MIDSQQQSELNDLLIEMHRSFLQYCGESWPYAGRGTEAIRSEVAKIVVEQQDDIGQLVAYFVRHSIPFDFGTYPDYSGLHYMAVDAILPALVENQKRLLNRINQTLRKMVGDQELSELLVELHGHAEQHLSAFRSLHHRHTSASSQAEVTSSTP